MPDAVQDIHGSVVQHGDNSNCLYLLPLNPKALRYIVPALDALGEEKGYGTINAKIPADALDPFPKGFLL
jgi:hypothetical protein